MTRSRCDRNTVVPIDLKMLACIEKRIELDCERLCHCIKNVACVSCNNKPPIPRMLYPAITVAIIQAGRLATAHRPTERKICDLAWCITGQATYVKHMEEAVCRVHHPNLLLIG